MTQETYKEQMRGLFGAFQDEWDTLARNQAETLCQTLSLQNGAMFSPNDAQKIKSACAKLLAAIDKTI